MAPPALPSLMVWRRYLPSPSTSTNSEDSSNSISMVKVDPESVLGAGMGKCCRVEVISNLLNLVLTQHAVVSQLVAPKFCHSGQAGGVKPGVLIFHGGLRHVRNWQVCVSCETCSSDYSIFVTCYATHRTIVGRSSKPNSILVLTTFSYLCHDTPQDTQYI